MLFVRLPEELEARLTRLSARTGRSKSYHAREALMQHIDDLEDHHFAKQRLSRSAGDTIPLDDLINRYGSEG